MSRESPEIPGVAVLHAEKFPTVSGLKALKETRSKNEHRPSRTCKCIYLGENTLLQANGKAWPAVGTTEEEEGHLSEKGAGPSVKQSAGSAK